MVRTYFAYCQNMRERDVDVRTNIKDARLDQCRLVTINRPFVTVYERNMAGFNEPEAIGEVFVDTNRKGEQTYVYEQFYDGSIRTVRSDGSLGVYLKKPRRR